jgi:hypothetical protein
MKLKKTHHYLQEIFNTQQQKFQEFVKINFKKKVHELEPWEYREALSFFGYLKVESTSLNTLELEKICSAIIKNENYSWKNLNLSDEAEIQAHLRYLGYEIKCFKLNQFPTDSFSFNELLIKSDMKSNLTNKLNNFASNLDLNYFILTIFSISALVFLDVNIWHILLFTYLLAALVSPIAHNYLMHDCNLVFRNTFLKFLGLGLFYFYVSDPSDNSKKFHAAHHNFWRTEHDPVVAGIKQNPFLYMLGFSSSVKLETIFADDKRNSKKYFREFLLIVIMLSWTLIFDFSSWVSYHLIPMWILALFYNRFNDILFHGPHTWKDRKKEKDIPWLMPIMFGSAYHTTHHKYVNEMFFGPGKIKYLNLEYWFTLLFFNTSKSIIR